MKEIHASFGVLINVRKIPEIDLKLKYLNFSKSWHILVILMVLKYLSYFWWSHPGDVLWLFPVSGGSGGTVYLRVCTPMWPWGHHGHIPQQRPRQEEEVRGVPPYLLCQNEVHPDQQGEKCQPQVGNIQGNKPPNSIQQLINSIYLKPQVSNI